MTEEFGEIHESQHKVKVTAVAKHFQIVDHLTLYNFKNLFLCIPRIFLYIFFL